MNDILLQHAEEELIQHTELFSIAHDIAEKGYAIRENWLDVQTLRGNAQVLAAQGSLEAAAVSKARRLSDVRGDRITWLDETTQDLAEKLLLQRLEALRLTLNRELQLGLFSFEAHYALYVPGATYARHLDRFIDDDARVISVLLYLNENWREGDRGELRLYLPKAKVIDIAPRGGTLVVFLSERFEHEVLAANRERWSIAAWFRRRAVR